MLTVWMFIEDSSNCKREREAQFGSSERKLIVIGKKISHVAYARIATNCVMQENYVRTKIFFFSQKREFSRDTRLKDCVLRCLKY